MSKARLCKICMRVHPKEVNCNDVEIAQGVATPQQLNNLAVQNTAVSNTNPKVKVKQNGGGIL